MKLSWPALFNHFKLDLVCDIQKITQGRPKIKKGDEKLYYRYQDTIITIKPGLGGDNFATCKLKSNGTSWTAVKTPAMPRTNDFCAAVNNLHDWAKKKNLEKADCGCCHNQIKGFCTKNKLRLEKIDKDYLGLDVYLRCENCRY